MCIKLNYRCKLCHSPIYLFESYEQHGNGFTEKVVEYECQNGCHFKPNFDIEEDGYGED